MSKPAQNFEEKKDACYTINGKRRIDRPDLYSKRLKTNVFSSNEQNKKAEINIGLCCFGNYFAAFAKALTKEIELFPDRSHLYSDRAKCYVHLKVFKDSLEDGLKAVHLDRLNIDGWLCVGESHFALGTSDECVEDLEKILGETNNQKLRNFLSYSYFMEASKAFEMNKFETAAKHYESASKLSDASLWIKLKLSECYAITGQFNKALVIADQLLKEKVTEAEGYYVHGQIKYYQNIIDVAFENFDKCLFLEGGHANCKELYRLARSIYVLKDRGNKYYNEKKYDFAYEMCDKGLNADPNNRMVNAVFNFNIGLIFLQQHKVADAIRSFSSAIDLNKRYIKALLQRAKLFQEFHQFQDAVQDLEQVNKIAPSPHHENLLQEATSQLKTEPQSTKSFCSLSSTEQNKILANSKKEKGNIQYKNKNYDEAKRLFSEAIALDPVCPIHYLNRSVCLMAQKMYEEALTDAGKSLEIDSTVVKGYLRKGKIELILGRGEEALQTFVQGLTINHKDKDLNEQRDRAKKLILYISMGDKAFEIKNFTEAAVRFGDAFDIASSCSKVMNMKYESLLYCNRWDEVSLWLSQQEKDANYYYISALMDYINCHKENALTNIEKALQVESNHLKAISLKTKVQEVFYNWEEGRRALTESNFTNARRLFEKASVLDPSNRLLTARVLCDLGNCFVKQGEFLKAIDHFTQAIQSKNDLVLPYLERAKCYDRLNKFEEALKDFRNVFKLSPNLLHKQYLYKAELKLKQSKNKDYYYLLSVTRNASRDDIKRAYRRLAKLYHPDKCVTAEDKKEGKIKFKEINQAYKVLSDPLKRQEYTKRFAEEF